MGWEVAPWVGTVWALGFCTTSGITMGWDVAPWVGTVWAIGFCTTSGIAMSWEEAPWLGAVWALGIWFSSRIAMGLEAAPRPATVRAVISRSFNWARPPESGNCLVLESTRERRECAVILVKTGVVRRRKMTKYMVKRGWRDGEDRLLS